VGRMARYSCDGLRDKLRAMLLDLGVRRDLKIVPLGCGDLARSPLGTASLSVEIIFSAPVLADPSRKPSPPGDTAGIVARFETFTITRDVFRNMGIGDCELVEAFTSQVLPKLSTRDVRHDITCNPHQQSGSRFWVRGEILRPMAPAI